MSLKTYRAKRNFKKTPEPIRKQAPGTDLSFVVQKHDATRLHYDFRIEFKGVLLSWAIPKGPPKKAGEKRLAIHVEDHPLSYGSFEGEIPAGNYGAGTVEIWDKGSYTAKGASGKKESTKSIQQGLQKGHLSLTLKGKKLKGEFDLVHLKNADRENMWILIKRK